MNSTSQEIKNNSIRVVGLLEEIKHILALTLAGQQSPYCDMVVKKEDEVELGKITKRVQAEALFKALGWQK